MTILPVNGTVLVQQPCERLGKLYEASFPDNKAGMHEAYLWAAEIALGFHESQNEDWANWSKRNAA